MDHESVQVASYHQGVRRLALFAPLALLIIGCKPAGEPTVEGAPEASEPTSTEPSAASSGETFEGRRIAQTMSYLGADWLTRPNRDAEENTAMLHTQLALGPGDVACDVGSGNGYHTLLMAKAVAPSGEVIASDLQPQMLDLLRDRAEQAGVDNLRTVQARPDDVGLPVNTCDLILLVDVYHEFALPEQILASMRAALSEGGRIALVEYREEDETVPIKPLHKMSKTQILAEYLPRGFELVGEYDGLPWQHLMFFGRAGASR